MPILVDGNNLLHRLPRHERSREDVRRLVLDQVRHENMTVTVVFDGPAPDGSPMRENLGRVTVVYSGSNSADDVIIDLLPTAGPARNWVVVTDDRGLATRTRGRGAEVRSLAQWRARPTRPSRRAVFESKLPSREVAEWESMFAEGRDDDDDTAVIQRRKRRRR